MNWLCCYWLLLFRCVNSGHLRVKPCKRGEFLISDHDEHVSRHLDIYGEWAEKELQLFLNVIKPGDIVVDVGANIGAFTIPLAAAVGPQGRVHAFEPQRIINQRLNANVAINDLYNVHTHLAAVGNESSFINIPIIDYTSDGNFAAISLADQSIFQNFLHEEVPLITLDSIDFTVPGSGLSCPSFIKVDVELMEQYVLEGARALLARCRPILYLENPCVMTSRPLVELLYELQYTPYWDVQMTFNRDNYRGVLEDIAPGQYAINMIGVPTNRISNNSSSTAATGASLDAGVTMIGYVSVEVDKPYLHQYFGGRYTQAGDQYTCGEGGVQYEQK